MKSVYKHVNYLTSKKQKFYLFIIFLFAVLVGLIETISISSLVGFIAIVSEPQTVAEKIPVDFIKNYILSLDLNTLAINASIILITIFLIKNITLILFHYCEARVMKNLYLNLSREIFNIYLLMPYRFHKDHNPAILVNTVIAETKRVSDFIVNLIIIFRETITLIFLLTLMLITSFKLAALLFLTMSIASLFFYKAIATRVKRYGVQVKINAEKTLKNLMEAISSIKILKLINKNEFFIKNVFKEMNLREKIVINFNIIGKLPRLVFEVLAVSVVAGVLLFILFDKNSIKESIPILSLVVLIILRTMPAFININTNLNNIRFHMPSLERIASIKKNFSLNNFNIQNKINEKKFNFKKIEINKLSYSYGTKEILNDINCEFEKNKIYGIKGESGSGKTTFIDLILGLLQPSKGKILINSLDLDRSIAFSGNYASYVPQEIYLTDTSIAENIAFGLDYNKINFDKLKEVLVKANLFDFINSLPEGHDTIVGEKGVKISGGQKQRVGIARALYFDTDIIVFDEATSALDYATEERITQEILKLKKDRIIFIVAHRLKTLDICDEVLTISNGKVIKN
jgi:ABC-type multidrug transport system fused ATPase/permease subunit